MPKKKNNSNSSKNLTISNNNSNKKFYLTPKLKNLFNFLTFITASIITVLFYEKIRIFLGLKQLSKQSSPSASKPGIIEKIHSIPQKIDSQKNQLIPCGSNLEKFVPKSSTFYDIIKFKIKNDCQGVGNISPMFAQINGYAYAAELCILYNQSLKTCSNMPGKISFSTLAKQKKLTKNLTRINFVNESQYKIVDLKKTIATVGLSFCVGVAITSPTSPKVLLAHINAENIFANDEHLKGKFEDPLVAIKYFVLDSNQEWKTTIVSGSPANTAYIKTVLENMGINNIDSYCEPGWANLLWDREGLNRISHGGLMIKEGQAYIIKNPQDFEDLFSTIPSDQKDKPAALKLQLS